MPEKGKIVPKTDMKDRIRQIMEAQHMTQQVFADFIGTTPATLSGIFNDRTRPSINIVECIKKKIPDINTDWLMFGTGQMYLHANAAASDPQNALEGSHLAGSNGSEQMIDFGSVPSVITIITLLSRTVLITRPVLPATIAERRSSSTGRRELFLHALTAVRSFMK